MNVIWWEKTVEYKFVLTIAKSNESFVAPLDGLHEKAGDALLAFEGKWILIEFKRDEEAIPREESKFNNYDEAHAALSKYDGHHHFIYGLLDETDKNRMQLSAKTYFSRRGCTLEGLLKSGIDMDKFKDYVEQFTAFKKTSSSGTEGVEMEEFSMVAAIDSDGNVSQCLKLSEFQQALKLTYENETTLTHYPKGMTL